MTHRSHNKHHLLWLKKPKHDKIDLATPTTPLFSSVKRVGMRRWRSRRGMSANVPKSIHNSATRAALSESIKQSGCPKGIASREWARHSSTRCELRRGETSWHSIFQRIVAVRNHISQCYCPCCGAPSLKEDYCGSSLIPDINLKELRSVIKYIMHPQNLLGTCLDPQDQQELQKCFSRFADMPCLSSRVSEVSQLRIASRICLYLSIVGCPSSVDYVAAALLKGSKTALEAAIVAVPHAVFRGGQRPLMGGRKGLASAVIDFDRIHGAAVARVLLTIKRSRSRGTRCRSVYDLVKIIVSQNAIDGFAEYRAKRYLELLALASTCNFGSISLKESDLDASWSIWPVPANTATGLKRFAPTACNEVLQRQALRLLARILHSMGNRVTLCMLSALVCFDCKESSGVMAMIKSHKKHAF